MLVALIVGLAAVNAVELVRFRRTIRDTEDPAALAWARAAQGSRRALVWTGGLAGGLNILGFLSWQAIGSAPFLGGRLDAFMAPSVPILLSVALVALSGLVIAALRGSRANRLRKQLGRQKPRLLNGWAKVGLFALGWFGFFLLSRYVAFHVARARGGFLL